MPADATPPTDDEIFTLALYGQAKAASVWEFHAKRGRGRGKQPRGGVAEQSESKCVDAGDSAAWSDSKNPIELAQPSCINHLGQPLPAGAS
jgi:hypothetical protein